jgi:hypothetical protein
LLDNFDDRYLGAKTSDPALDNDGNALVLGALYFNTTDGVMKVYTASGWIAASSASVATLATFEFVATSGQTVFTGNDANGVSLSYVAPALIVTLNGVRLRPGDDYTATNGTSITLVSAAALNDELVVDAFGSFLVANTYTIAQVDALLANEVSQTSSTGAANLPSGTTGERPGSPVNGQARYNSTLNQFEVYQNGAWTQYAEAYSINYLVVAGGGGGGCGTGGYQEGAGGGGAGGLLTGSSVLTKGTTFSVTVGAGGAGQTGLGAGANGANSVFSSITAIGGGGGGTNGSGAPGSSGGSGGGAGPQSTNFGSGTAGQGNNGGQGFVGGNAQGGGGGGAGAAGGNGSSSATPSTGVGGVGIASSISGSSVFYAGGGGGGGHQSGGVGGNGGGGNGAYNNPGVNGTAGTANRGGGGGGGSTDSHDGQSGGSGVVILSYPGSQRGSGGTVTSSGGNTIHTFTSSGTFTA